MTWPDVAFASIIAFLVLFLATTWKGVREYEAMMRFKTEMDRPQPFFFTRKPQSIEEAIQMLQEQQDDGED